jgi:hypothetical protein
MAPSPGDNGRMQITSADEYRHALERINQLRAGGKTVENNAETADLQAAVSAYEGRLEHSDTNKGKPRSKSHGRFDTQPKR